MISVIFILLQSRKIYFDSRHLLPNVA